MFERRCQDDNILYKHVYHSSYRSENGSYIFWNQEIIVFPRVNSNLDKKYRQRFKMYIVQNGEHRIFQWKLYIHSVASVYINLNWKYSVAETDLQIFLLFDIYEQWENIKMYDNQESFLSHELNLCIICFL